MVIKNMKNKIIPLLSYLGCMIVTVWLAYYAVNFLIQKSLVCDANHIGLCTTEQKCLENGLYWWSESCHQVSESQPKPSEYPDYDATQNMKEIVLVENYKTYTPNGKFLPEYTDYGIVLREGKIAKGYIEFVASIKNKPLTDWESLYFKVLHNREDHFNYGGHIFREDSLKMLASDKTHLLYALNNIPFIQDLDYLWLKNPKRLDLFNILNTYKEINFLTYISSLNPAKIDSIKIYYECDESFNDGKCELLKK